MKNYLLAFDKFKGSLTALEACEIAAQAIASVEPDSNVLAKPLTDGGEGFCEIVTTALEGVFRDYQITFSDFRKGHARVGYVMLDQMRPELRQRLTFPEKGMLAVIEMAQAAGHQQVDDATRDVWQYSTVGVGELLRYASLEGASHALIGMGGSSTNDMGFGLLQALGMKSFSESGEALSLATPATWSKIARVEVPSHIPELEIRIACDVKNPLHGPEGSAAIYGPQKGLKPEDLTRMQEEMKRISCLLEQAFSKSETTAIIPGMGAAGGLPFGLSMAFESKLLPGFELIADILNLEKSISESSVVITGEGAMDASSLQGKGPFEIVQRALAADRTVCVFAGKVFDEARTHLTGLSAQVHVHQVGEAGASIEENIRNERKNLAIRIQENVVKL